MTPPWYQDTQWIIVVLTGFIFLATAVYAVFAGFQWLAIRQQARISERTLALIERPHIVLDSPTLKIHDLDDPTKFGIDHAFRNYGKGPGRLIKSAIRFHVGPELPDTPNYGPEDMLFGVIVPEHGLGVTGAFHPAQTPTNNELLQITERRSQLFFYGFIEYRDIQGSTHRSCFAYRYVPHDVNQPTQFETAGPESYWVHT